MRLNQEISQINNRNIDLQYKNDELKAMTYELGYKVDQFTEKGIEFRMDTHRQQISYTSLCSNSLFNQIVAL